MMNDLTEPNRQRWRDPVLFVLVPGLLCIAISLMLRRWPPVYPAASLAAALSPPVVALFLAVGGLGVLLSPSVRFPQAPGTIAGWRTLLLWSLGIGLAFGLVVASIDAVTGFSEAAARHMGLRSIHVEFPQSLGVYTVAAVVTECFYRLAPIPIAMWLVARLARGPRASTATFLVLALLTSLIEPAQQFSVLAGPPLASAGLAAIIFGINLEEAWLFRRYGWPAPLATRLAFYLVWHVVWPLAST